MNNVSFGRLVAVHLCTGRGIMNIDPARIGFDIDGVVADTAEAFIRLARRDYGMLDLTVEDITEFKVEDCLPMAPAAIEEIFNRLLQEPLAVDMQPMPHAMAVLTEMANLAPLTFVTARSHREPIAAWLQTHLGETAFSRCRLTAMGEHDDKAAYIREFGLEFFVDDRARTCQLLNEQGITPIVYEQPWNRGRHNFTTVNSWLAIRNLCLPDALTPGDGA